MKFTKQIEGFIELRIAGNSFDEIATTLKTTKQTLIEWNKQMNVRDTINDGKAIKINSVVKTYQFDLLNRLNNYLQLSKNINDELLKRDLTTINTDTLLKMSIANDGRLKDLLDKPIQFGQECNVTSMNMDNDDFFSMQLDD